MINLLLVVVGFQIPSFQNRPSRSGGVSNGLLTVVVAESTVGRGVLVALPESGTVVVPDNMYFEVAFALPPHERWPQESKEEGDSSIQCTTLRSCFLSAPYLEVDTRDR